MTLTSGGSMQWIVFPLICSTITITHIQQMMLLTIFSWITFTAFLSCCDSYSWMCERLSHFYGGTKIFWITWILNIDIKSWFTPGPVPWSTLRKKEAEDWGAPEPLSRIKYLRSKRTWGKWPWGVTHGLLHSLTTASNAILILNLFRLNEVSHYPKSWALNWLY